MKQLLALCIATVLFAPTAAAQIDVTLTGQIERLSKPGCNTDATHAVACTDVLLFSETVDLATLEGQTVRLTGQPQLQIGCVTIDVDAAAPTTERTIQFALFGYRIGRTVTFTTFTPIGSAVFWFWSCEPGFLPLGDIGTYLLDPFQTVFDRVDISIGISLRNERIPDDPSLVGNKIYYQTGYASLTDGFTLQFLNANCFTITD